MREDWTLAELIGFFRNEPFDFEPGTKWHYDNSGYVLLGAILEKVTGRSYADVVADWIFTPARNEGHALRKRGPDHSGPRGRIPEGRREGSSTRTTSR